MDLVFNSPVYLWFFLSLPALIVVHFYTLRYAKGHALEFANFAALARVARTPVLSKNITLLVMRMFTLSCIILAVSGAVFWYSGLSSGKDFVLAIDTSSSMLAADFEPNRLEVAKSSALEFLEKIPPKTKVGVVSFSGTAFVALRPSDDFFKVKQAVNSIEVQQVGGTDLGEAIVTSSNLVSSEEKENAVILLTDGRSNVGLQPFEAVNYANDNHVSVYTIGVGTEAGGLLEGTEHVVLTLDETTLKEIASRTNAQYFKAETVEELKDAYKEIANVSVQKISLELTMPLILIALLASLIDWFLINTKHRRIP